MGLWKPPPLADAAVADHIAADVRDVPPALAQLAPAPAPRLLRNLPGICCCQPRLVQLLVGSLDPPSLAAVEEKLSLGHFSLVNGFPRPDPGVGGGAGAAGSAGMRRSNKRGAGKALVAFRALLEASCSWDWAEQDWLWRLLTAESHLWMPETWDLLLGHFRGWRLQHLGSERAEAPREQCYETGGWRGGRWGAPERTAAIFAPGAEGHSSVHEPHAALAVPGARVC